MERNTELLQQTMQYILDHPHQHRQSEWFCGTSACFAGHAWLLSGHQRSEFLALDAAAVLGLTHRERAVLFHSLNRRPVLELMVKDLVNGDELRSRPEYLQEVWQNGA